jgi:hypothetical protein
VQEVHDEIIERYEYEVGRRTGAIIDDDPNLAPAPLTEASIRQRLEERTKKSSVVSEALKKFPDGYYLDEERHASERRRRALAGAQDEGKGGNRARRPRAL